MREKQLFPVLIVRMCGKVVIVIIRSTSTISTIITIGCWKLTNSTFVAALLMIFIIDLELSGRHRQV